MPEFSPYPFPFYCLPCRVVNYLQGIHVYSWGMQPTNQPVVAPQALKHITAIRAVSEDRELGSRTPDSYHGKQKENEPKELIANEFLPTNCIQSNLLLRPYNRHLCTKATGPSGQKIHTLTLVQNLSTTATSLQWPLSSVLKVTVVQRFNCISGKPEMFLGILGIFLTLKRSFKIQL